jgi:hypothetical protein
VRGRGEGGTYDISGIFEEFIHAGEMRVFATVPIAWEIRLGGLASPNGREQSGGRGGPRRRCARVRDNGYGPCSLRCGESNAAAVGVGEGSAFPGGSAREGGARAVGVVDGGGALDLEFFGFCYGVAHASALVDTTRGQLEHCLTTS